MDVFEAVRTVLAVREYQDKPVPPDAIRRILDSAHLTASSRNGQPWHFVVIQDGATIRKLATLAMSGCMTVVSGKVVTIYRYAPGTTDADIRALMPSVLAFAKAIKPVAAN